MPSSVFQALSLPIKGSCHGLGPVTVSKLFKPGVYKGTKIKISGVFQDGSGEIPFTLWEPASKNCALQEGSTYVFDGSFERGEYPPDSGKAQLSSQNATIASTGGNAGAAQGAQNASGSAAGGGGQSAPAITPKDLQIMRQNALSHATALVVSLGVKDIFMAQDDVLELARRFTQYSATGKTGPLPTKAEMEAEAKAKAEAKAAAQAAQEAAAAAAALAAQTAQESPAGYGEEELPDVPF